MSDPQSTLPSVFLPHGGGPWTIDDMGMGAEYAPLAAYLKDLERSRQPAPKAVLCISAHWEEGKATVQSSARPPMLYDYSGFPPETYEFVWPAPGNPELAEKVRSSLEGAGFATAMDAERGFDHGTFVPLMLADPQAGTPTLQLSLLRGLDPKAHLDLGRALASLRKEGVLIVGSGMSYHNMRAWMTAFRSPEARKQIEVDSRRFDDWLEETLAAEPSQREQRLVEWAKAPAGRESHPREEHLLPLMVVAGAAIEESATSPFVGSIMGAQVRSVEFT